MPCRSGVPKIGLVAGRCYSPRQAAAALIWRTVKGVVTLDGKALEGGSVTFIPETSGPLAYSDMLP